MTGRPLAGRRVAVLSTLGFERVEPVAVRDALLEGAATVHIVAPKGPTIRAFEFPDWADEVAVDRTLDEASPAAPRQEVRTKLARIQPARGTRAR